MKYLNKQINIICSLKCLLCMIMVFPIQVSIAQQISRQPDLSSIDTAPFADNAGHLYSGLDKIKIINPLPGHPKYEPTDLVNIGDNILRFQKTNGGWPKNHDVFAVLTDAQKNAVEYQGKEGMAMPGTPMLHKKYWMLIPAGKINGLQSSRFHKRCYNY